MNSFLETILTNNLKLERHIKNEVQQKLRAWFFTYACESDIIQVSSSKVRKEIENEQNGRLNERKRQLVADNITTKQMHYTIGHS